MASMNRVFLMGNLTRDPEVRYTPSGQAVADLGLAISEKYRNKAGEMEEKTCFVDVVVWARQAETCGEYLSKGSPILCEGSLQLDQWQTESGEKRSRLRVRAARIQFLSSPRRAEVSGGAPAASTSETAPQASGDTPGSGVPPPANVDDSDDLPF